MSKLAVCAALLGICAAMGGSDAPVTIYERPGEPAQASAPATGKIDELIVARLKAKGISPSRLCSDAVFVRRVCLDVTGTLPTADEAAAFLADKSTDKRAKLIDRLMNREEFADYWAMRWGDVLRIKSEFPINLWPNAVQAYHRWVRTAIKDNMPYDRFARELLTSDGSNFRSAPVNFYRATTSNTPESLGKAAALVFMGDRTESWPGDRKAGLTAFFSRLGFKSTAEWKEQIVYFDRASKAPPSAMLPTGRTVQLPPDTDPREVFADWLISAENPWFARCAANRIWFWLLGRGLVHEPDDFRPDNPAVHPDVLDYLAAELVKSKYDVRHVMRLILNSNTYQSSSIPRSPGQGAIAMFATYPLQRMDAETLIDAISQISGATEEYSSSIPEPFTWVPAGNRTIALCDGSITSSFLDLFGRPPRDSGLASERNNAMTAAQALHLLNSSHIRNKIENGPALRKLRQKAGKDLAAGLNDLYLTILSRYPTPDELKTLKTYADAAKGTKDANFFSDVTWALINSPEFLYRH